MNAEKKNSALKIFKASVKNKIGLPLAETTISAGFPSPADDYTEARLDLNKELISNASATFYARVKGDSMTQAGISDGDLLIIDKSKTPENGSVVICFLDGEFTVKKLQYVDKHYYLMPENPKYSPIRIEPENNAIIWGVVTYTVKKHI